MRSSGITALSAIYAEINVGVMSTCEAPIPSLVKCSIASAEPTGRFWRGWNLAKELPSFINEELVDIGESFPFYDDYIKGSTTALVTAESRANTQLCLVGDFVKTQGDLMVLRNLWARMGSFTNHQATVTDFDWGEERLIVNNVF